MEFTCHSISDGHPYNGKTIGWCVAGDGKIFVSGYLSEAQKDVMVSYPDATFRESLSIDDDQLPLLLLGEKGLRQWYRDGRPFFEMKDGLPVWDKPTN